MRLVFNELSAVMIASSRHEGREWMDGLMRATATLAGDEAVEIITAGDRGFFDMMLSDGYTLSDWLGDREADRDQKRFFGRITTKIGLDEDMDQTVMDRFYLSEFFLDDHIETARRGPEARGLGLAFLLDTVALSLPSEEHWRSIRVRLRHLWLEADGSEKERSVDVFNISKAGHGESVGGELLRREQTELRANPLTLADRMRDCFPHLSFGQDVDDQMFGLPVDVLKLVMAKLTVLDDVARDWRRGTTGVPVLPKVHTESEPTMQQFGHLRRFRDADGRVEVFMLHAMVGSRHRIHFRIKEGEKSLEVGYVGVHLPTKKFH